MTDYYADLALRLAPGALKQTPINDMALQPRTEHPVQPASWGPPDAWSLEASGISAVVRQALRECRGDAQAAAALLCDSSWTSRYAGGMELDVLRLYIEKITTAAKAPAGKKR